VRPAGPDLIDDAAALEAADASGTLRSLATAGPQVRESAVLSVEAGVPALADQGRPRAVLVAGVGDGGAAGDLLVALTGPGCPVPVLTWRGFGLPAWVGAADLLVAVTGSGATEETLSALEEAVRRGCPLLVVAAPDSPAEALARRGSGTFVPVPHRHPAGAGIWALAAPLVVAADALGLTQAPAGVLEEAALVLEAAATRCRPDADAVVNPAKALALALSGVLPMVWGTSPVTGAVAHRFADQLSRNAAVPALAAVLPEAAHTALAVLHGPFAEQQRQDPFADPYLAGPAGRPDRARLRLVLLRDVDEHPVAAARAAMVQELAEDRGTVVDVLTTTGESPLERLASLVTVTDYASAYLALLQGRDPGAPDPTTALTARTSR